MAEAVKKTTAKKTTTATKKTTVKKEAAPVVEEAEVKVEAKKAPKKAKTGNKPASYTNRVKTKYETEVKKALVEKFNYSSIMQVPALKKIVINIGVGDAISDSKRLEEAVSELTLISGQKPVVTKAKKSIANYKLREGQEIGCKVTLRGQKMYEFYDKLVSITLPRVRDFRGVSANACDGRGNYTLGVKEQSIFPEIEYDKIGKIRGMDICIVTSANTDKEALALLTLLGMPFAK